MNARIEILLLLILSGVSDLQGHPYFAAFFRGVAIGMSLALILGWLLNLAWRLLKRSIERLERRIEQDNDALDRELSEGCTDG